MFRGEKDFFLFKFNFNLEVLFHFKSYQYYVFVSILYDYRLSPPRQSQKFYCLNFILICMHLFLFKSYKYFVFFSILYNNRLSYVFYLCLNCFEVSDTLIICFAFIFSLLFEIHQTYSIILDPII